MNFVSQMPPIKQIAEIILRLLSFGLVITAGGFWAGAGVETRPKYRDEQTLVAGAIWSQTIIPIGLLISMVADSKLDIIVHGYFLISGVIVLISTGFLLIIGECIAMARGTIPFEPTNTQSFELSVDRARVHTLKYDKVYLTIGILCFLAGILTFAQFILLML